MYYLSRRFFTSTSKVILTQNFGGGIVQISLNRAAARNALSIQLVDELDDAIRENCDARCIILRSEVPGMFCAGADLKERKGMDDATVKEFLKDLRATFCHLEQMACPTISVIDGPAMGGGTELALCTDIRIATIGAIFALPETGLAIIPGAGGTQRLTRLVGESRSKELIFTGDRLTGEEAHKIGLVNHVLPDYAAACAKAFDMAQKIGEKGPIAIRAAKKAINGAEFDDLKKGLDFEAKCCETVLVSEDRLEGLKAFAEKRKPVY